MNKDPSEWDHKLNARVRALRNRLVKEGWCFRCGLGEAINRVEVALGRAPYDWRRLQQEMGYICDCSERGATAAPPALIEDDTIPF